MKALAASFGLVAAALAACAPGASATSPGREGRIAFVVHDQRYDDGRLVTARPDGSDMQAVADRAGGPAWSADGGLLAYGTLAPIGAFVARADGSNPRRVADAGAPLALSPGARTIVVGHLGGAGGDRSFLEAVSLATGKQWRVASDGATPVFSPNGRSVAYVDQRQGHPGISTVRVRGGHRRQAFRGEFVQSLDWSPDNRTIAFVQFFRKHHRAYTDLRIVDVRTGHVRRLARRLAEGPGGARLSGVSWSPTGRRLLVAGWNRTRAASELLVVGARTGHVAPLGVTGEAPAWQPLP
ncbi:MAG: Dipeptidyl peptidase N-terminal region [Thermoleophilaceae bacterium]|nr:Dipeptidyl peptidase N-terminal region [Thermoleophilaceae bacterium]